MTVIVGVPNGNTIVLASDSCEVDDEDTVFTARKIFTIPIGIEQAAIGGAGNSAVFPIMRWKVQYSPAPQPGDRDDEDRWAQSIADSFTELAREAKIVTEKGDVDGILLLAFRGRLWSIEESYAAPVTDATAIGSGGAYALGALAALEHRRVTPTDLATKAVEIACRYNAGCRPPVVVVEV